MLWIPVLRMNTPPSARGFHVLLGGGRNPYELNKFATTTRTKSSLVKWKYFAFSETVTLGKCLWQHRRKKARYWECFVNFPTVKFGNSGIPLNFIDVTRWQTITMLHEIINKVFVILAYFVHINLFSTFNGWEDLSIWYCCSIEICENSKFVVSVSKIHYQNYESVCYFFQYVK